MLCLNKFAALDNASSTQKLELISREIAKTNEKTASFRAQIFGASTTGGAALDLKHIDTGKSGTLADIIREGQAREFSKRCHPELVAASLVDSWLVLPLAAKSSSFAKNRTMSC